MRDLTMRNASGRPKFKLRASHRSLQFHVSHHRPTPGLVPDKDRDLDEPIHPARGKRKK